MINTWPESVAAWERTRRSLPGGVSTGMRVTMRPHPLFFDHGSGPRLVDVDGNSYLDYVLGWGPVILGHAHPALTEAVVRHARLGATFGAGHRLEYQAAEAVLAAVPGMDRVLWSNTGSEATQVALRLARAATGRQRFVKMIGHYHGWTDTFLLGYRPDADGALESAGTRGQSAGVAADVDLVRFGDLGAVAAVLEDPENDIAAVFVEPVLCNSGVIEPPAGYLEGLRVLCDRTGTVLVFDEVITGFRIAYGGAVERYGVRPDLVVLAKAIAGGYPLSAVAGRAELVDQTQHGLVHAGTYNGNPVSLAAGLATITALSASGVYDRLEARGRQLADGMRQAMSRHGLVGAVNQVGPVVQCCPGVVSGANFTDFLAVDQQLYDTISIELVRRGVYVLPGGRWYLSTAHTADDVAHTVRMFDEAVGAVTSHTGEARPAGAAR